MRTPVLRGMKLGAKIAAMCGAQVSACLAAALPEGGARVA